MIFNWLDIVLFIIIAIAFILGLSKGLIRQAIGILAVIIGLILALSYYAVTAEFFLSVGLIFSHLRTLDCNLQ